MLACDRESPWLTVRSGTQRHAVRELARFLSKRPLVRLKSTLRWSIRRARARDLIGRNVIDLIDLRSGRPGRSSRAVTEEQAAAVLEAAKGQVSGW